MAPIILGYWDIRGYAHPIRFLLEAAKADYEDEFYFVGGPPSFSKEKWFSIKPTLPLDFPDLPYMYDGDVKITQSMAITRYLARKFGFDGKTEQERIRIDLVEQQVIDWRSEGSVVFYSPDLDHLIEGYKEGLKQKVESLSKFLGKHDFLSGGGLSYVDFMAFEWMEMNTAVVPTLLDNHTNLKDFMHRIREIPEIKKYMSSPNYIDWPFTNNQAKILSRYSDKPKV